MRRVVIIIALLCAARTARADFAIGGFFGDPTGLDLKLGLAPHSGLDIVAGWRDGYRHIGDDGYVHVTYLVTPVVAHGDSVIVPLRLGIGGAVFGPNGDNIDVGVRFPLEIGLRFRRAPLEIYGEIALLVAFIHPAYDLVEGQGGLGIRFYF